MPQEPRPGVYANNTTASNEDNKRVLDEIRSTSQSGLIATITSDILLVCACYQVLEHHKIESSQTAEADEKKEKKNGRPGVMVVGFDASVQ